MGYLKRFGELGESYKVGEKYLFYGDIGGSVWVGNDVIVTGIENYNVWIKTLDGKRSGYLSIKNADENLSPINTEPFEQFEDWDDGINENTISSPFSVDNLTFRVKVEYDGDNTIVKLVYKDEHYQEISVDIPESKKLDKDEFFMNHDVDINIIKQLIEQNFIEKTDKVSKSGLNTIYSYKLV